jgi:hypothetical protein
MSPRRMPTYTSGTIYPLMRWSEAISRLIRALAESWVRPPSIGPLLHFDSNDEGNRWEPATEAAGYL